jgi:hypothetical protein
MSISKTISHGSYQEEISDEEYSESEVEEPPKKAMKAQKNKNDDSGADEQGGSTGKTLKKKPAGKNAAYNIDDSDVELEEQPVKRDKNMVSWFKQYEHTLPKVVLLLIGSLATIAFDIPPHYLETFNHTCCANFV